MYIRKEIAALDISQIAYPVGINKDSYNLYSYYSEDVETGEITVIHQVYKNWYARDRSEALFTGTIKECYKVIIDIVNKEGEWVRDGRLNYVHNIPTNNIS
jgi:hypothetical protein